MINQPVNCGATVPSVNFENVREAKIAGLYCSRMGSTLLLISSDAAYDIIYHNIIMRNNQSHEIQAEIGFISKLQLLEILNKRIIKLPH